MSFNRHGVLLSKYSLPPSRKTRRVIVTSCQSRPSASSHSEKVIETSAMPTAARESVPLKMTSAISPPRSAFADCSPSTQRMASRTFDLPHPFGPTTAVTPRWNSSLVFGAKDLKPKSSSDWRYMRESWLGIFGEKPGFRSGISCKHAGHHRDDQVLFGGVEQNLHHKMLW